MEDPVRFDVYGKVPPGMAQSAADFSVSEGTYSSRSEALKAANHSTQHNVHIILMRSVGWLHAQKNSKHAPWAMELVFCQEGYEINDKYAYCQKHNLQYGGILGCHVCSGFYVA
jgi:hypothetical protein